MNILAEKPVFQVRFKAVNIGCFIKINGSSVYNLFGDSGQVELEYPVNQFMRSGLNELRVSVLPPRPGQSFAAGASVKAELVVKPAGKSEPVYKLGDICFDAATLELNTGTDASVLACRLASDQGFSQDDNGDVEIGEIQVIDEKSNFPGAYTFCRNIVVTNGLPLWGFFDGDEIPDPVPMSDEEYNALVADLLKEYMKIQDALADGSEEAIDAVMPLFSERNNELDQAFYLEMGTTEKKLRASMLRNANDPDRSLVPLTTRLVRTSRHDNKKLIALTRNGERSAIVFNVESTKSSTRYDIVYYKKDGKWIISR